MHFEKPEVLCRYRQAIFFRDINPASHIFIVTIRLVITVSLQLWVVIEERYVRVRIGIKVVEFPVLGTGSIPLYIAPGCNRPGKKPHVDIFAKERGVLRCIEPFIFIDLQTQWEITLITFQLFQNCSVAFTRRPKMNHFNFICGGTDGAEIKPAFRIVL